MSVYETARLDEALRAAGIPIDGVSQVAGVFSVQYAASATAQNRTDGAAIVAAFDASQAATDAWLAAKVKARAKAEPDGSDEIGRLHRAFAAVVLSEINALRQNAGLALRTANQLKTAIANQLEADA
jgi:hypothetical protein